MLKVHATAPVRAVHGASAAAKVPSCSISARRHGVKSGGVSLQQRVAHQIRTPCASSRAVEAKVSCRDPCYVCSAWYCTCSSQSKRPFRCLPKNQVPVLCRRRLGSPRFLQQIVEKLQFVSFALLRSSDARRCVANPSTAVRSRLL